MTDETRSSQSPGGRAAIAGMADERRPHAVAQTQMNDEPRSPLSPGGHEAVDLGEDDGPVTYQACDFADLDRIGDRDAVPVYNVDPRNGTPKRKDVKLDVPWPPPSPPLSPTEEAQQLVKMMMCAGFDERGVTYDEAVGPPPPPYSPRPSPEGHAAQDQDSTCDDSGDEVLQDGPSVKAHGPPDPAADDRRPG